MDFNNYLYIAIRAALDAGKSIMDIYTDPNADFEIEKKADNSPLTLADRASNRLIVNALSVTVFPPVRQFPTSLPRPSVVEYEMIESQTREASVP